MIVNLGPIVVLIRMNVVQPRRLRQWTGFDDYEQRLVLCLDEKAI